MIGGLLPFKIPFCGFERTKFLKMLTVSTIIIRWTEPPKIKNEASIPLMPVTSDDVIACNIFKGCRSLK